MSKLPINIMLYKTYKCDGGEMHHEDIVLRSVSHFLRYPGYINQTDKMA